MTTTTTKDNTVLWLVGLGALAWFALRGADAPYYGGSSGGGSDAETSAPPALQPLSPRYASDPYTITGQNASPYTYSYDQELQTYGVRPGWNGDTTTRSTVTHDPLRTFAPNPNGPLAFDTQPLKRVVSSLGPTTTSRGIADVQTVQDAPALFTAPSIIANQAVPSIGGPAPAAAPRAAAYRSPPPTRRDTRTRTTFNRGPGDTGGSPRPYRESGPEAPKNTQQAVRESLSRKAQRNDNRWS